MCCCFANVMSPKLLCFIGELSDTEHVMVMNHRTYYWTHARPRGNESRPINRAEQSQPALHCRAYIMTLTTYTDNLMRAGRQAHDMDGVDGVLCVF